MKYCPNFLIAAGTGRNVGKTTLVCNIIKHIAKQEKVIAVKITPHFHESGCELVYKTNDFSISLEKNKNSGKDTAKMLAAGADCVYYVQANDDTIPQVLEFLLPKIPNHCPVVCETGALRNYIVPGLFFLLTKTGDAIKNQELVGFADRVIVDFKLNISTIDFMSSLWRITELKEQ